jgi:hypothetical protein
MTKCDLCGKKIDSTFLNKILGTVMRDSKGKKKTICSNCQKQNSSEELKEKLE